MPKNIEIISRAFLIKNGKVLLCKDKKKDNYFFPGGHVEFGETSEQALKRELQEEIGTEISNIGFAGICETAFETLGEWHQEINIVFAADIEKENIKSLENHLDYAWLNLAKIADTVVYPENLKDAFVEWMENKKTFHIA